MRKRASRPRGQGDDRSIDIRPHQVDAGVGLLCLLACLEQLSLPLTHAQRSPRLSLGVNNSILETAVEQPMANVRCGSSPAIDLTRTCVCLQLRSHSRYTCRVSLLTP